MNIVEKLQLHNTTYILLLTLQLIVKQRKKYAIYSIPCNDCDQLEYNGQTKFYYTLKRAPKSNWCSFQILLCCHACQTNHTIVGRNYYQYPNLQIIFFNWPIYTISGKYKVLIQIKLNWQTIYIYIYCIQDSNAIDWLQVFFEVYKV